jgi:DNA polymerase-3 subunit alpha
LKANYPAEFMAALLSSEIGNSDKLPVFATEAVAMELNLLPPDVNHSGVRFKPEGKGAIRYGLAGIKNVGEGVARVIAGERGKNGPYKSLMDFCGRLDAGSVNKKAMETLVRCGAMDSFGMHRARLFGGIDFALARVFESARDRRSGQGSLFSLLGEEDKASNSDELPECPKWREGEMLAAEKDLLGLYMSGHPLMQYEWILSHYQTTGVTGLRSLENEAPFRVGGVVAAVQNLFSKKDRRPFAIITLEGLDGSSEIFVFGEVFDQYKSQLVPAAPLMLCGKAERKEGDDSARIRVYEIYPLTDIPRLYSRELSVHLPATHTDDRLMETIRDILHRYPGEVPVIVCLLFPGGEKVFIDADKQLRVMPCGKLIHELEHLLGGKMAFVHVHPGALRHAPIQKRWEKKRE